MSYWHTVLQVREETSRKEREGTGVPGPFVTISRQYGCSGLTLGLLLAEILNEHAPSGKAWKVYGREILEQLARESDVAAEFIERAKRQRPKLVVDFFRSLSERRIPSGREVRNRITALVRGLAYEGYVIIIGQGGVGATADISDHGISVRLEAPLDWRVAEVCKREGLVPAKAREEIRLKEKERAYLRRIYSMRFPREPAFDIAYDNSRFTLTQIALNVAQMMQLRHLVP